MKTIYLKDLIPILPTNTMQLKYESTIQIVDYNTLAHFRKDCGNITLGGSYYADSEKSLLEKEVKAILPDGNTLEIYILS